MLGFGFCCCCTGCTYFNETFDRSNSTDLGVYWTEEAGDWEISSNKLAIAAADAVALCTELSCEEDSGTPAISAMVTVNGQVGDKARVLVNYVDANNHWLAEVEFTSASGFTLKLFEVAGGVETQRGETATGSGVSSAARTIVVCMTADNVSAWADVGTPVYSEYATTALATSRMGLATGDAATGITFDNLILRREESVDAACYGCRACAHFALGTIPYEIQVEISGITNGPAGWPPPCTECANFNGIYVLARVNSTTLNTCQWQYEIPGSTCDAGYLKLTATYDGAEIHFYLSIDNFGTTVAVYASDGLPDNSDCTAVLPLDLTFDPAYSDWPCTWSDATTVAISIQT